MWLPVAAAVAALVGVRSAERISYTAKLLAKLQSVSKSKATPARVVSRAREPWPEPDPRRFNTTKILWGFWDRGRAALPGQAEFAVRTWQTRHPDWAIVILSDDTYRDYVSPSDLPTTFNSLKVQHRSDILRLAVLARFGGAYLDVSTIIFRSFDGIWDSAADELYLTTAVDVGIGNASFALANNALLMAPRRGNRVIMEWHRRLVEYAERPCETTAEMQRHAAFKRVAPYLTDPALGVLKDVGPYCSFLWILADLLHFDPDFANEKVIVLPQRRWTFDFFCFTSSLGFTDVDDPSADKPIASWSSLALLREIFRWVPVRFDDDPLRARRLLDKISVIKVSSDGAVDYHQPPEWHLAMQSTLGRLNRAAANLTVLPIKQANTVRISKFPARVSRQERSGPPSSVVVPHRPRCAALRPSDDLDRR
jgi:hypothetical protein